MSDSKLLLLAASVSSLENGVTNNTYSLRLKGSLDEVMPQLLVPAPVKVN